MGLSRASVGAGVAFDSGIIQKENETDKTVALAGNPNVGKSTLFNNLTGMHQHTGNWPGKTVSNAQGRCTHNGSGYVLVDLPGCYSLLAHSAEEECASDFLCFGGADGVAIVCDATCLERNMNLVLQTLEITGSAVVCVNLMDEAKRCGVEVDIDELSRRLCVPVVGMTAKSRRAAESLLPVFERLPPAERRRDVPYPDYLEQALAPLTRALEPICGGRLNPRLLGLKMMLGDERYITGAEEFLGVSLSGSAEAGAALSDALAALMAEGISQQRLADDIARSLINEAHAVCDGAVVRTAGERTERDIRLDRILTGRRTGFPIMLLMLMFIFWLTITGANYPSDLLSVGLFRIQDLLLELFERLNSPQWLTEMLVLGVYRVLAWVVSVMLPPMAIFFPLFTLLEDLGYLPRIAFNLDRCFKRCSACGKQALTMCMGLGCNAAGVVGCRIIDSPRERLIAIITNTFMPCNGRFPTLITIIGMFFIGSAAGLFESLISAVGLTLIILLGVIMTLLVSKLLSKTVLKGVPSSFTLELPPYRRPQIGKVIIRSILDRTLFVLGRAVCVAAPAGLIIWLMANVTVGGATLLSHCAGFLDPFARLMGMDGVILLAFILGLPANEIVVPIIIMAYMSSGSIMEFDSLTELKALLVANGWDWITAVSTMLFMLMHWPCSTTCITVKKETGSLKWTAAAFLIPTAAGMLICLIFTTVARLF
jgi:ferrous iron transport protein B